MDSYGNLGFKGISLRRAVVSSLISNNIKTKRLSVTESAKLNDVTITTELNVLSGEILISSKDIITNEGFTVGGTVTKDMGYENYTTEFDPGSYTSLFPGMTPIIDENIVAGDKSSDDRLIASFWDDLGNDVFDDWGYFYLYDVNSAKYYFPLIEPRNQNDGIITTQIFNVFGRTFTINHGWCVQGIFKFDISVADDAPFQYGAYGNFGSDENTYYEPLTYQYNLDGNSLTLYYHHNYEDGDSNEILYNYFVPKVISENEVQTYDVYYDNDEDMHIRSKEVTKGLIVYFSKRNDVKDWVVNDLQIINNLGNVNVGGKLYVEGNILSKGYNIGKTSLKTMNDTNYIASASSLINGYFKSNEITDNRFFVIPSAASIVAAITNCAVNTSIRFTINNVQAGNYNRTIDVVDGSVTVDSSCYNTNLNQNMIVSYVIVITNIDTENETAVLLQENSINGIIA
jgi:hypothetical protein